MCEIATDKPNPTAWIGVPRDPTRYAAINVLPWPGVSAWPAPIRTALRSEPRRTSGVRSAVRKMLGSSPATPPGTAPAPDAVEPPAPDAVAPPAPEAIEPLPAAPLTAPPVAGAGLGAADGRTAFGSARASIVAERMSSGVAIRSAG